MKALWRMEGRPDCGGPIHWWKGGLPSCGPPFRIAPLRPIPENMRTPAASSPKGLRRFLDAEQQRAWLEGEADPADGERSDFHETLEQRFKFADRFEKLLKRPQADDVLDILKTY